MKGFLSKLTRRLKKTKSSKGGGHAEDHRGIETTTTTKKQKKKSQNNDDTADDDASDENNNNNNNNRRKRKQQEKTAQKIREKQAHDAFERSANSVRAISGLASGSMRLLPNKNGKKPISTKTNVQGMVVGLAALGVARSMAERSVVAKKKKKKKREEGVSSEEEEEEEEKRTRSTTNGTTVKFAAMMATFIVKPVTFTGAFVLREVYRSALALLGETNKDDGSSSSLKNGGGESVLMLSLIHI